jgi:hypothetical protein
MSTRCAGDCVQGCEVGDPRHGDLRWAQHENVGPLSRTTDLLESRAPLRDGAGCPKNDMPAKVDVGNILVLA